MNVYLYTRDLQIAKSVSAYCDNYDDYESYLIKVLHLQSQIMVVYDDGLLDLKRLRFVIKNGKHQLIFLSNDALRLYKAERFAALVHKKTPSISVLLFSIHLLENDCCFYDTSMKKHYIPYSEILMIRRLAKIYLVSSEKDDYMVNAYFMFSPFASLHKLCSVGHGLYINLNKIHYMTAYRLYFENHQSIVLNAHIKQKITDYLTEDHP